MSTIIFPVARSGLFREGPPSDPSFFKDSANFADAFNQVLFDGRRFFRAEDLEDCALPEKTAPFIPPFAFRPDDPAKRTGSFRIVKRSKKLRLTLSLVYAPEGEGEPSSHTDRSRSLITVFINGKSIRQAKNIVTQQKSC